jgi:translation initiation factor 2 beta subunit (eIF-2beta)/eIF-5
MSGRIYERLCADTSPVKIPAVKSFQVGIRKTVWVNFVEFCQAVTRDRTHVASFMEIELRVEPNTDMDQRLVIKGRFRVPEIIKVVQKIYPRLCHLQGIPLQEFYT